jgi:hypothetical protein
MSNYCSELRLPFFASAFNRRRALAFPILACGELMLFFSLRVSGGVLLIKRPAEWIFRADALVHSDVAGMHTCSGDSSRVPIPSRVFWWLRWHVTRSTTLP